MVSLELQGKDAHLWVTRRGLEIRNLGLQRLPRHLQNRRRVPCFVDGWWWKGHSGDERALCEICGTEIYAQSYSWYHRWAQYQGY